MSSDTVLQVVGTVTLGWVNRDKFLVRNGSQHSFSEGIAVWLTCNRGTTDKKKLMGNGVLKLFKTCRLDHSGDL